MDPQHDIDWSRIGRGVKSMTREPDQSITKSNLPIYNMNHSDTGAHIDLNVLRCHCDNTDDYEDVLNHKKTAMRFISDMSSAKTFDIRFLDTSGINDTNFRDVEHAQRIIEAMVQVRSFNAIIIVIDAQFLISKELQVVFSYYSRVIQELQGDHNNIVFIYTYVKYAHSHHSNTDQLSKMKQRHKVFSYVFQSLGRIAKGGIDLKEAAETENVKLYPYFTIDLETSNRPIRQGMIRDAIRGILQKVVETEPTALDISEENRERVFAIKHPDEDNHKQREKAWEKQQVDQKQQHSTGLGEKCDPADYAALAESLESPGPVVETVDSRAEDRENELLYFGSVQVKNDSESDE